MTRAGSGVHTDQERRIDGPGRPVPRELRSARDRIAELQRRSATARQALEAERLRYQELFESAPVAYLVTDAMARIHEANRAAAALLGVGKRFLAGKPLAAYVEGSDRWEFRSMVNRLRVGDQGRVADWPLRFRRRGGEVLTLAVTVEPIQGHDGGLETLRWLLRRLEPEAAAGQALPAGHAAAQDDARRRDLEALEDLDVAADLDGTVQVLLDAGVRLLGVDGIGLMLADGQGRLCAAGGSDDAVVAFLRAQEHVVKGPCVHAFLLERSVQARCLDGGGRWPQLAEAAVHAVGAALATPIGLYGGPVGPASLVSVRPKAWTDTEQLAAEAFASVLAAMLELAAEAQRGGGCRASSRASSRARRWWSRPRAP